MQSDSTRVLTYLLKTPGNAHRMSHKARGEWNKGALTTHQRRDLMFSEAVSKFLIKLKNTKEADGNSLLDHSLVAYGTGLRSGHGYGSGPMILAGRGGGGVKQGQNIVTDKVPLGNVWLSMLRHIGYTEKQFGNSDGVISEMGFS